MSDTVVDSSVVAKWFFPEPDAVHAKHLLDDAARRSKRLIVLDLALVEVTNVIWKYLHRKQIVIEDARRLLDDLLATPVHIEPSEPLLRSALEIAAKYDRAVYDALFVALAQRLDLSAVTADEPLYRAVHADYPQLVLLRDWVPVP